MTDNMRHWAYSLPPIPDPRRETPSWAREAVAEHKNPDYWAWIWGWSETDIVAAKKAAGVL